jgi:hypothetical protein
MDDDVVNRLARELADAIGAAVTEDAKVEACRERARAAGYEMRVSLEAVVGFGSTSQTLAKVETSPPSENRGHPIEITANDRRFLRSLRIATDEISQQVE